MKDRFPHLLALCVRNSLVALAGLVSLSLAAPASAAIAFDCVSAHLEAQAATVYGGTDTRTYTAPNEGFPCSTSQGLSASSSSRDPDFGAYASAGSGVGVSTKITSLNGGWLIRARGTANYNALSQGADVSDPGQDPWYYGQSASNYVLTTGALLVDISNEDYNYDVTLSVSDNYAYAGCGVTSEYVGGTSSLLTYHGTGVVSGGFGCGGQLGKVGFANAGGTVEIARDDYFGYWEVRLVLWPIGSNPPVVPTAVNDGPIATPPGVAKNIPVGANDTGFANPVTVTVTIPPTKGTIGAISPTGPAAGMSITYTANIGESGVDSFVYEMADGTPASDSATVALNIGPDADADNVLDAVDNCTLLANVSQCDSDGDGYGNRCDGDMNNNGSTNAQDTTLYRQQLGQPSVGPTYNKADLNCNGAVNAQDTTLFRQRLGSPPGPSGLNP